MKQAKINCPHCGHRITVNAREPGEMEPERAAAIWKAAEELRKAMDRIFQAAFGPLLKR